MHRSVTASRGSLLCCLMMLLALAFSPAQCVVAAIIPAVNTSDLRLAVALNASTANRTAIVNTTTTTTIAPPSLSDNRTQSSASNATNTTLPTTPRTQHGLGVPPPLPGGEIRGNGGGGGGALAPATFKGWSPEPVMLWSNGLHPAVVQIGRHLLIIGGLKEKEVYRSVALTDEEHREGRVSLDSYARSAHRVNVSIVVFDSVVGIEASGRLYLINEGDDDNSARANAGEGPTEATTTTTTTRSPSHRATEGGEHNNADSNKETRWDALHARFSLLYPVFGSTSAVSVGSSAYVLGCCNLVPRFVDTNGSRSRLTLTPDVRSFLSSVQQIRVFDDAADSQSPDVMLVVRKWSLPSGVPLRFNASCVSSGHLIYIIGGVDAETGATLRTIASYNVDTLQFTDRVWDFTTFTDTASVTTPTARALDTMLIFTGGGIGRNVSVIQRQSDDDGVAPFDGPDNLMRDGGWRNTLIDGVHLALWDTAYGIFRDHIGAASSVNAEREQEEWNGPPRPPWAAGNESLNSTHLGPRRDFSRTSSPKRSRRASTSASASTTPTLLPDVTPPQLLLHGNALVVVDDTTRTGTYDRLIVWNDLAQGGDSSPGGRRERKNGRRRRSSYPFDVILISETRFQREHATLFAIASPARLRLYLLGGTSPFPTPANGHTGASHLPYTSSMVDVLSGDLLLPSATMASVSLLGFAYGERLADRTVRAYRAVLDTNSRTAWHAVSKDVDVSPEDWPTPRTDEDSDGASGNATFYDNTSAPPQFPSFPLPSTKLDPAAMAQLMQPLYTLDRNGRIDSAQLSNFTVRVHGYLPVWYNVSFRLLISLDFITACPMAKGLSSSGRQSDVETVAMDAVDREVSPGKANAEPLKETAQRCSLMLSTSPHCDAPIATLHDLSATYTRVVLVDEYDFNGNVVGRSRAVSVGDFVLHGSLEAGLVDVVVTGAASRGGSSSKPNKTNYVQVFTNPHYGVSGRKSTLHVLPESLLAWSGEASGDSPEEEERRARRLVAQSFLYVCLSTGEGVVAGCSASTAEAPLAASTKRPPCSSSFYVPLNANTPYLVTSMPAWTPASQQTSSSGLVVFLTRHAVLWLSLVMVSAIVYVVRLRHCAETLSEEDWEVGAEEDDTTVEGAGEEEEEEEGGNGWPRAATTQKSHRRRWWQRRTAPNSSRRGLLQTTRDMQATGAPAAAGGGSEGEASLADYRARRRKAARRKSLRGLLHSRRGGVGGLYERVMNWSDGRGGGDDEDSNPHLRTSSTQEEMEADVPNLLSDVDDEAGGSGTSVSEGQPLKDKLLQPQQHRAPAAPRAAPAAEATSTAVTIPSQQSGDSAATAAATHTLLDGKYRVMRRLGKGSFSIVYLVERVSDGRPFALKYVQCADDLDRREALKECEVAYALQGHPNVIELVDMFLSYRFDSHLRYRGGNGGATSTENGTVMIPIRGDADEEALTRGRDAAQQPSPLRTFSAGERYLSLVMAYHADGDLGHWVRHRKRHAPIAEATIVSVAFQVLSVLQFMHRHEPPIVHRDLKPENLLLASKTAPSSGQHRFPTSKYFLPIVVTDFGLSRVMDKTFCETGVGSLPYVAPECWRRHYSTKVDIWALGCILYAMCTKRVESDNVRVMFSESTRPDFAPKLREELMEGYGYSASLAAFISLLLEVDPANRPSAEDALQLVRKRAPVTVPTTEPSAPAVTTAVTTVIASEPSSDAATAAAAAATTDPLFASLPAASSLPSPAAAEGAGPSEADHSKAVALQTTANTTASDEQQGGSRAGVEAGVPSAPLMVEQPVESLHVLSHAASQALPSRKDLQRYYEAVTHDATSELFITTGSVRMVTESAKRDKQSV